MIRKKVKESKVGCGHSAVQATATTSVLAAR